MERRTGKTEEGEFGVMQSGRGEGVSVEREEGMAKERVGRVATRRGGLRARCAVHDVTCRGVCMPAGKEERRGRKREKAETGEGGRG